MILHPRFLSPYFDNGIACGDLQLVLFLALVGACSELYSFDGACGKSSIYYVQCSVLKLL